MELDDLKAIWATEKIEMEKRITLDEQLIKDLAFEKSASSFDRLLKTAILGRNLALVYMFISIVLALQVLNEFEYSIPALIGGAAMLWSFVQHLSLQRPDFSTMNTIDLQKAISRFRIHTAKFSKYDFMIVSLWLLTSMPIYFKGILKISVSILPLYAMILALILLVFLFSNYGYKKWDLQLKENEDRLQQVNEFAGD